MVNIQLTFRYEDTSDTRQYELECADSLVSSVKEKVLAINASLAAGTDEGLSDFFVSDDGDRFTLISSAKAIEVVETPIDLGV